MKLESLVIVDQHATVKFRLALYKPPVKLRKRVLVKVFWLVTFVIKLINKLFFILVNKFFN